MQRIIRTIKQTYFHVGDKVLYPSTLGTSDQLTLTLFMFILFLYSDDEMHFKHNKIPHKMACGFVSIQG